MKAAEKEDAKPHMEVYATFLPLVVAIHTDSVLKAQRL
jgi:hypothetical protein